MTSETVEQFRERRKTRVVQALGIELRRQGVTGCKLDLELLAQAVDKII
jgi:hypothetical protein